MAATDNNPFHASVPPTGSTDGGAGTHGTNGGSGTHGKNGAGNNQSSRKTITHSKTTGSNSLWSLSMEKLRANKAAMVSAVFLLVVLALCFIGPLLLPVSAQVQNLERGATAPSLQHWFGTDELGRDLLARLLVGGRISFAVGFLATAVSLLIGVAYGVLSGLAGGWLDRVMMRFVELVQALPFIIFVILLVTLFGRHLWLIFIAIGAVEWLTMARIIRTQVLELKGRTFVQAAQVMGQSPASIAVKHLLPNLAGLIIVYASLTVPAVILLESLLSFLGLGVQAPMTSWGDLLKVGAENMEEYPWQLVFPAIVFCLTLLSLNTLGDALREAFDPRS